MAKIPATLITGFLGAGKTTLIRNLMLNAEGRRIALIVNEFGETGIDGDLLAACGFANCRDEDIQELANGCLCCTVADDFLPTMEALLDRAEPPEHILIETSGLALPKPLVKAFAWPEVRTRTTMDGVITLVDGLAVVAGLFAADPNAVEAQRRNDPALDHASPLTELFTEQVAAADLIVIGKADRLDAAGRQAARQAVSAQKRAAAQIVESSTAGLPASVLLGLNAQAEEDLDSRPSQHDGLEAHEHDDFASFVLRIPEQYDAKLLLQRVRDAAEASGALRVKGFAAIPGKPMRLVIQGVGPRFEHYYNRYWGAEEARETRLVFIGLDGIDPVTAERHLLRDR